MMRTTTGMKYQSKKKLKNSKEKSNAAYDDESADQSHTKKKRAAAAQPVSGSGKKLGAGNVATQLKMRYPVIFHGN